MTNHIKCPHCGKTIKAKEVAGAFGRLGGQVKSEAKAAAARENGKKGGRPRKKKMGKYTGQEKYTG